MLFTLLRNRGDISFLEFLLILISYAMLIFIMLPVHELAHAYAAYKLGDDTARWNGRLRFHPLAHLDPIGTVMLVLFGFGYARPVPVNPRNFRNPRRDMALTALAGPLSNILMAAASIFLFRVVTLLPVSSTVLLIAEIVLIDVFVSVNIGLAVFNLLPVPPLDGSRIFAGILPSKWVYTMEYYSRYITMGMMLLLFAGVLDYPLNIARNFLTGILFKLFGF